MNRWILKNNFPTKRFKMEWKIFFDYDRIKKRKIILDKFDNVHVKFSNFQSVYGRFSR